MTRETVYDRGGPVSISVDKGSKSLRPSRRQTASVMLNTNAGPRRNLKASFPTAPKSKTPTHLQCAGLGNFESLTKHTRVDTLLDIPFRLFEQFTDQENHARRSITTLLVLCDSRARDHRRGRILIKMEEKNATATSALCRASVNERREGWQRDVLGFASLSRAPCRPVR